MPPLLRLALLAPLLVALAAAGPTKAERDRAELDRLLAALRAAPSEQAAGLLESRIRQIWLEAGSPAATLLMGRGVRDLGNNADDEALEDFESVLALEPDLPEGYAKRGLARFGLGDYAGAVADIGEALKREPRHFGALQELSRIAEARGDAKGALEAWRRVLDLDPNTPGGRERLKLLETKAFGEST